MPKTNPDDHQTQPEPQPADGNNDPAAEPTAAPAADPSPDPSPDPDGLLDDLKRIQAEFLNYRRRAEAERAELMTSAKLRVVRDFLAVRDSFDQELAHRPESADPAWAKTIDAIRTQFDQVLNTLGVARFESKGQPFDPRLHDAVAAEGGEGDHEVVTEELQPGYKLGSTVLRHAVVKVGRTSEQGEKPGQEEEQT